MEDLKKVTMDKETLKKINEAFDYIVNCNVLLHKEKSMGLGDSQLEKEVIKTLDYCEKEALNLFAKNNINNVFYAIGYYEAGLLKSESIRYNKGKKNEEDILKKAYDTFELIRVALESKNHEKVSKYRGFLDWLEEDLSFKPEFLEEYNKTKNDFLKKIVYKPGNQEVWKETYIDSIVFVREDLQHLNKEVTDGYGKSF